MLLCAVANPKVAKTVMQVLNAILNCGEGSPVWMNCEEKRMSDFQGWQKTLFSSFSLWVGDDPARDPGSGTIQGHFRSGDQLTKNRIEVS